MSRTVPAAALLLVALAATPVPTGAAESTADWLKRILDPSTLGVTPFPGSTLNRKITVDTIRYDRSAPPAKRTAVYLVPVAEIDAAARYFTKALGTAPRSDTDAQGHRRHVFVVGGKDGEPPKARGLQVAVFRSPWVDGMAQIQMEYLPPP
jgi:hypothetical protein